MNIEETKKAAEVMLAWAEGKRIQNKLKCEDDTIWRDALQYGEEELGGGEVGMDWNFIIYDYRIKPESHYRPFENEEEAMVAIKEHGSWVKSNFGYYRQITAIYRPMDDNSQWEVKVSGNNWMLFTDAFNAFHFIDGSPFGKLVEE